jgi:hypothetical protein
MSLVRHRLGKLAGALFLALAVFVLCGGHWGVFQAVAWVQMIHNYSRTAPLAEAVERTLSGEAPCAMCHMIQTEKKKETRSPFAVKVDKKAEGFLVFREVPLDLPADRPLVYGFPTDESFFGPSLTARPPIPIV